MKTYKSDAMFPSRPPSHKGRHTNANSTKSFSPAAPRANHIVTRNSIDTLNVGGASINSNVAMATNSNVARSRSMAKKLPKLGQPLPKKITLNDQPYKKAPQFGYNMQQEHNTQQPDYNKFSVKERKYIHSPDNRNRRSYPTTDQEQAEKFYEQYQQSIQGQGHPPYQQSGQGPGHQQSGQGPGHHQSGQGPGHQPFQPPVQGQGHQQYQESGQGRGRQPYQHSSQGPGYQPYQGQGHSGQGGGYQQYQESAPAGYQKPVQDYDGDPYNEGDEVQYYEEEISSSTAPSYNPGYLLKEPAPFKTFPQPHGYSEKSGGQDYEEGPGHYDNQPTTRQRDTGCSDSRPGGDHIRGDHDTHKYTDHRGRYPNERFREQRRHTDKLREERRHTDYTPKQAGSSRSSLKPATWEAPPSSPPTERLSTEPSDAIVQNILSSMKGLTNPLLNKGMKSGVAGEGGGVEVSDFLRNHIREVAKQLIEENGLSGSLDIVKRKDKNKSVSPLKITTTRKRFDSGKRSRSRSPPKQRSSKDRRRSHSRERERSRHNKRGRRSRERESRREKNQLELDNDTIKRIVSDKYPKLAATLEAGEQLVVEHHSSPIQTVTGLAAPLPLPPPLPLLPTGALPPPPPLLPFGSVEYTQYPGQFVMPPPYTPPSFVPSLTSPVSSYRPIFTNTVMLPPPVAQPEPIKPVTGPMPNKGKKTSSEQTDLLRCSPCNLNFKTKKDGIIPGPLSPVEINIASPATLPGSVIRVLTSGTQEMCYPHENKPPNSQDGTLDNTDKTVVKPVEERVARAGHAWVQTVTGHQEVLLSMLETLDAVRGMDLQECTANIKRTVDVLQYKWGFEVTSVSSGWQDIEENAEESVDMIKELHKKCWESSKAYLTRKGVAPPALLKREREMWDVFEPLAGEFSAVMETLQGHVQLPHNPSFTWAIEHHRTKIRQDIVPLQELAYQRPPDKFKYLDKWGDDLQNIRHEMRKSIEVAELLIGGNFEGSTTWQEILNIVHACLDTLDALKNMCFDESAAYMKKQKLQLDVVNRRVQIGNCFNDIRTDLAYFKEFVKEKSAEGAPFIHLHLLEYRRQKLIDLVQNIASL